MLTVLDIGARGGPADRWHSLGSQVEIVGIDADPDECARLSATPSPVSIRYLSYAVGRHDDETATLHICRQAGCSSLYHPNTAFVDLFPYGKQLEVVRTLSVTLTSLDTICERHAVRPNVVKIDTQGAELDILCGGRRALQSTLLVELEVEFNPQYVGQPLFGDVDAEMRRQGFLLLGLKRSAWRRTVDGPAAGGTLMHGDALYIRDPLPTDAVNRRGLAHALAAYRQYDLARVLDPDLPTNDNRSLVKRLIGRVSRRMGTHRELRGWIDGCRPQGASDWHDPEFF